MSSVMETYEKTKIGAYGSIKAAGSDSKNLENFKSDLIELGVLESSGLIEITNEHRESQVNNYVDLVMFKRLE